MTATREQKAAWKAANPERWAEIQRDCMHRNRQRRLGMAPGEYEAMLAAQDGLCAICRQEETKVQNGRVVRLAIDHDHETGRVRALLCDGCNRGIGYFREDVGRLLAAAAYLLQHESR